MQRHQVYNTELGSMNAFRRGSRKQSQLFFATIAHTLHDKEHVFMSLEDLCSKLVVAEEKHYDEQSHHHIYMRTVDKYHVGDVVSMLKEIYDMDEHEDVLASGQLNVSTVRSEKSVLRYVSKEDCEPLIKGICENQLSFYYRSIKWAANTPTFSVADPFVLNHPQYYKLLSDVHEQVHSNRQTLRRRNLRPYVLTGENDQDDMEQLNVWQQQVVDWWNDWVERGFEPKKRQLYLWGPSNVGKTHFVHQLLARCINEEDDDADQYEQQVFTPTPNDFRFAYQEFDATMHNVMLVDEFDFAEYNLNDFKKATEGRSIAVNCKGTRARRTCLRMPMIFISNHAPPIDRHADTKYAGIANRIQVVYASTQQVTRVAAPA